MMGYILFGICMFLVGGVIGAVIIAKYNHKINDTQPNTDHPAIQKLKGGAGKVITMNTNAKKTIGELTAAISQLERELQAPPPVPPSPAPQPAASFPSAQPLYSDVQQSFVQRNAYAEQSAVQDSSAFRQTAPPVSEPVTPAAAPAVQQPESSASVMQSAAAVQTVPEAPLKEECVPIYMRDIFQRVRKLRTMTAEYRRFHVGYSVMMPENDPNSPFILEDGDILPNVIGNFQGIDLNDSGNVYKCEVDLIDGNCVIELAHLNSDNTVIKGVIRRN